MELYLELQVLVAIVVPVKQLSSFVSRLLLLYPQPHTEYDDAVDEVGRAIADT